MAGVSLQQIMDRLGHIDDQITNNVYLTITQEVKKRLPISLHNLRGASVNLP
ncbi:hypothetical protein [Neobacillus mesonae]|uniref:hypothetical protein n=1 Tax=Neobacillus mesonae TaxID=1193713 RepID=UPI00203BD129|nr:hypothetical protein [Neobacillus mesonae]MCM3569916.1 hypothetical protein [Neobacillus mesonae]